VLFKDVKNMGVGEFINESRRILKLATKPSRKELWMATRVSLLAMVLVGMVSFIIQIIMTLITGNWGVITS
jgi:protein translocase SEC61 complex gamma subunit